jgi:enoyl-CoA hydratase/carnithine racemase
MRLEETATEGTSPKSQAATGPVLVERDGDVAILTMSFAPYNLVGAVLSPALISGLAQAVDMGCRAIILRSNLRHFSAGADMAMFDNQGANFEESLRPLAVLKAFEECPLPIIASVHGIAVGGGFELALACDLIVAASSAKLGLVEASLGLHPLMGGIQRVIQRVGVARAKEIVMLGRRLDAATLEQWHIINRVVPDAQLYELTLALAREIALGPTVAHGGTKRLANIYLNEGMEAADAAMKLVEEPIWKSGDLERGLRSYREQGPGLAKFSGN